MPLKQIVFLALLLGGIVALAACMQGVPRLRRYRVALLVLAPAWIVDINLFFVPYRGTSSGLELGTPDLVLGGLWLSVLLETRRPRLTLAPPWSWPLLAFGAWSLASACLVAPSSSLALWEVCRFARAYLVFALTLNLVRGRKDVVLYVWAVTGFVLLQGLVSAAQVLQGVYRVHGSFAHSNPLGISMVTLSPLLLTATFTRERHWLHGLAFAAGALCIVFTRSRASLALLGAGVLGVFLVGAGRAILQGQKSKLSRLGQVAAVGLLATLPLAIRVSDGVIARFKEAPESSATSRDRANDAAKAMFRDNVLLGVGLNHYVSFLDRGYGRDIEEGDKTIVHHLYWLTAAELGAPGLALLLLSLGTFLVHGARTLFLARDEWIASVALGLCVGFGLCQLQHLYEWALRKPQVLFQVSVLAGVLLRLWAVQRSSQGLRHPKRGPRETPQPS